MKKGVLAVIIIAVLLAITILAYTFYVSFIKKPDTLNPLGAVCLLNQANIQSISCTKTTEGYLIQAKLNYSGSPSVNISKVAFLLGKNYNYRSTIVKFLNFSSSDYTFTINNSEADGLKKIGAALRIKETQCDISDEKNITCS